MQLHARLVLDVSLTPTFFLLCPLSHSAPVFFLLSLLLPPALHHHRRA